VDTEAQPMRKEWWSGTGFGVSGTRDEVQKNTFARMHSHQLKLMENGAQFPAKKTPRHVVVLPTPLI
jgi:hypothetical protein